MAKKFIVYSFGAYTFKCNLRKLRLYAKRCDKQVSPALFK